MSKAEELLDSLSIEDIQPFTSQPDIEGHIVIDKDRIIHVPTELKRIAVQYDSNIETVTFDCPRYWDEHDLSEMNIYINYKLPGNLINNIGQSLVKNLRINEDDENIINFDWTIGPILTNNKGDLPFSVCAKSKTNQDSDEAIRWYTEINAELTISEGMDGSGDIEDNYEDLFPDVINDIISKLEGINATYDEKLEAFNTNATSKTESFDTNAETKTTEFNNNATTKTNEFDSNAIEKTEAFNANANGVLKKSNTFINGLMNAALTNEVEGVENVINDGIECPLFKMEVDGHTNEQVVTTGKNKLQITTFNDGTKSKTLNGVTANINENGTISLSGTASAETQFYLTKNDFSLESGDGYFWCNSPSTNCRFEFVASINGEEKYLNSYSTTPNTFNITSSFVYSGSTIIVASGTSTNITLTPMVSNGTFTEYEPYTGGYASPSPNYEQPINSIEGSLEFACRGKSLFGGITLNITREGITFDTKKDGSVYAKGTALNRSLSLFSSEVSNNLIEINPGIYTISGGSKNASIELITDAGTLIASTSTLEPFSTQINIEESKKVFLRVAVEKGKSIDETLYPMLIKGSNNSNWEPYIEPNEVTFNLNDEKLRSVGDVKDELVVDLDTGDYYKVENVGEVVYINSNGFYNNGQTAKTLSFISPTIENIPINYGSGQDNIFLSNIIGSKHVKDATSFNGTTPSSKIRINIAREYLNVQEESNSGYLSALNELLQSLNEDGNPFTIHYPLATPTTKKLGTLDADQLLKLATLKGYNYITVTGIVDGELVNLNSRITYIQNANDYREIQNGKIAKMINNHPKQNIEGIDNTFDDAVDMELFELGVEGKSEQVTTTGKNLLNYTNIKPTNNGITNTLNDDGSITTTGSPKYDYLQILNQMNITDLLEDGQMYTIMQKNATDKLYIQVGVISNEDVPNYIALGTNLTNTATFTVDKKSNKSYSISIQTNTIETSTDLNITNYYQLLKGSYDEWQPFEKYTGGQPSPNPDYPQEITTLTFDKITRCGKNLATENFANQNSSINLARTLKKGEKITIVVNMTATDNPLSGYGINIYDQYNEQLWGNSYTNWQTPYDGWNSFVVTVKNDTSRLRINCYGYQEVEILTAVLSGALVVENKYVNDGSLYEPYQGQTYDIDLQGNEMVELPNGVKDELVIDKYGNVSLIKNIGKVILDGSENNWDWNMITEDEKYRFSTGVIQSLVEPSTPCLSNYFMSGSADDGDYFVENTIEIAPSGGITICTYAVSNSIEEFRAWLQEHNVIVYYQLANPQLIPLGTLSELITTLNGTNNIFINGNIPTTISIIYALDIKKYIDNKIAELSAQLIKGE